MHISFAETLRRLRLEKGISQQKLADLIHVERSTIASWETGRRLPDAVMISQLSEFFGVDVARLLRVSENSDKILTVILLDDEKIILDGELSVLKDTMPDADIHGFTEPDNAIRFAKDNKVHLAFVDIEMGRVSGLDVCRKLMEIEPHTNIIFLTAYSQYALDAWKTDACGFLEKPLSPEGIREQLSRLRYPLGGML
ncbi:MAG: response regulator [Lachnospiraceae bacterium]|nr:response regulator [Lachnospiraceae bacterium]